MTTPTPTPHTYIAGQDQGRLAQAAETLGLERHEARIVNVTRHWWNDDTLTAAKMHSVGFVAPDERVDSHGTLHLLSLRRRRQRRQTVVQQPHATLTDLFAQPDSSTGVATTTAVVTEGEEEGDEQGEDEVVDMVEGGSLEAAAFGIVKGTIGPAILYLPAGFYKSGWVVAIPSMVFATSMFVYNAYRLLECWRVERETLLARETRLKEVQSLLQSTPAIDYGSNTATATTATTPEILLPLQLATPMLTYPELARRALGAYAVLVEVGIALFQFGVCLTYLIFVPENLYSCGRALLGIQHAPSKLTYLWTMIAMEIPLCWIRNIRRLTLTNVIASLLIAVGLASVLVMAVYQGSQVVNDGGNDNDENGGDQPTEIAFVANLHSLPPWTDSWFLFIGTSFFMMEGSITLIVPLQEAVFRKEDKAQFPHLNAKVTGWICGFYIVFSLVACTAFGASIQTALTASLQGHLATLVQLCYSVAVVLTFPLQAFPAMEVALRLLLGGRANAESNHVNHLNNPNAPQFHWRRNILATGIVLALGVIAVVAMDYLANVVSLLGSLFGIPLALVFPPIMHNILVKDSGPCTRLSNYLVVVVGFLAMGAASYNTIVLWGDQGSEQR